MKRYLFVLLCTLLCTLSYADDQYIDGHKYDDFEVTDWYGMNEPAVSPARSARVYYNATEAALRLSVNSGPYNNIMTSASAAAVYVPYIGATGNVNLGTYSISANTATTSVVSTTYLSQMTALGDIIYGGAAGAVTRLPIGAANTVLHSNGTPQWSAVVEDDISLSNVTTNNATIARHGFLPTISGDASQYLNGAGNFTTPSGVVNAYISQAFNNVSTVSVVHNFGAKPLVQTIGQSGQVFIPNNIQHDTNNTFAVQFSVATSGTVLATVGSPQPQNFIAVNSDYTVRASDYIVKVTTGGITVSLPIATGAVGRVYIVDNATTGTASVVALGGCLIEGETEQTLPSDSAMNVYCSGSDWRIY